MCATLLRDLRDGKVPVSTIIRRILQWPLVQHNQYLQRRLEWELNGFPEERETLIRDLERIVKRAGLWESYFGPVEELERFILIKGEEKGLILILQDIM